LNGKKEHSQAEPKPIKVVSYGIGVIGRRLAKHLLTKEGVKIVGAIDINPAIVGKDLGEVLGREKLGVVILDARAIRASSSFIEQKPPSSCWNRQM